MRLFAVFLRWLEMIFWNLQLEAKPVKICCLPVSLAMTYVDQPLQLPCLLLFAGFKLSQQYFSYIVM